MVFSYLNNLNYSNKLIIIISMWITKAIAPTIITNCEEIFIMIQASYSLYFFPFFSFFPLAFQILLLVYSSKFLSVLKSHLFSIFPFIFPHQKEISVKDSRRPRWIICPPPRICFLKFYIKIYFTVNNMDSQIKKRISKFCFQFLYFILSITNISIYSHLPYLLLIFQYYKFKWNDNK